MGGAFTRIGYAAARRLIGLALAAGSDAALDAATALLHLRMERINGDLERFQDMAWNALERQGGLWRDGKDTMADYYAEEIGKMLAPRDPVRMARAVLSIYDNDNAPDGRDSILNVLAEAAKCQPAPVWDLVAARLYPLEERDFMRAYRLRLALEKWFTNLVPADVLLAWAERTAPEGPKHLAALASVGGNPIPPLAYGILSRFGADVEVRVRLFGQFTTGGWWGPTSNWLRGKLLLADQWALDADPNVRSWAVEAGSQLRRLLEQTELNEVERGY
jgi:hypothetical protein